MPKGSLFQWSRGGAVPYHQKPGWGMGFRLLLSHNRKTARGAKTCIDPAGQGREGTATTKRGSELPVRLKIVKENKEKDWGGRIGRRGGKKKKRASEKGQLWRSFPPPKVFNKGHPKLHARRKKSTGK